MRLGFPFQKRRNLLLGDGTHIRPALPCLCPLYRFLNGALDVPAGMPAERGAQFGAVEFQKVRLVRAVRCARLPVRPIAPCAAKEFCQCARRHTVCIIGADIPCRSVRGILSLTRRQHQIGGERF